jgi:streptogramin lyase
VTIESIVLREPVSDARCTTTVQLRRTLLLTVSALACASIASAKPPPIPAETKVVRTGESPCGAVAREGALWVGVYSTGTILRIDPASGRVTKTIRTGRWSCRLAVSERALWVTRDRAGLVVRVDRRTGRHTAIAVGKDPFDVMLAKGSVWVSSYGTSTIARFDARTGRMTRVYRDGTFAAGLSYCGGRIWVGHGRDPTWLTAIDPSTHKLTRVDTHVHSPAWPRCVRGEMWATNTDSVLRVDPRAGVVRARVRLGGTPAEAAAGPDGLVWVTDKERSLVFRIDPGTDDVVDSFAAGPGAYSMVRTGSAMWVTSFAGADVRRYGS